MRPLRWKWKDRARDRLPRLQWKGRHPMNARSQARLFMLYRVMYESFTPGMMGRLPFWLARRMAASLGWTLTKGGQSVNDFLLGLMGTPKGQPAPISASRFAECAGGSSLRTFRSLEFYRQTFERVWRAKDLPDQVKLEEITTPTIDFPDGVFPNTRNLSRRELR